MPLIDSNDPANWNGGASSLYRRAVWTKNVEGAWIVQGYTGYQREQLADGHLAYLGDDAILLIESLVGLGLTQGQTIALVGAGFGWVAEQFVASGYGPMTDGTSAGRVCAIDTSTWIQANLTGNAQVSILNADVNASSGRNAIKSAFNLKGQATVDWCVTEDVLPLLIGTGPAPSGNNEIQPFCSSCRQIATHVVHWITPLYGDGSGQDSRLNWKTMDQWKAWVSPDYVVQRGTSVAS